VQPRTLDILRRSDLVKEIVSIDFDAVGDSYRLKVRVRLRNNWVMDVWEHAAPGLRRYSYHVFYRNRMIVRWDNAPHFPSVKTFPHHRHMGRNIEESGEMTVDLVLEEIRMMMR